jgi:hypothetical protein
VRFHDALGQQRFTPSRIVKKLFRLLRDAVLVTHFTRTNRRSTSSILGDDPVTISLTTFGHRLRRVHVTIESIASGTAKASRVVLWLDQEIAQTPLPDPLRRLAARGLDIRYTKNYRSHKKYYPFVTETLGNRGPLVTADDDVMYPRRWLADLLSSAEKSGRSGIVCHRAHRIVIEEDGIAPYRNWTGCRDVEPTFLNVATGMGGVFYPEEFLKALVPYGEKFTEHFAATDDLWLHLIALRHGFPARQVSPVPRFFPTVPGSQAGSLVSTNLLDGNDESIRTGYTEADRRKLLLEVARLGNVAPSQTGDGGLS